MLDLRNTCFRSGCEKTVSCITGVVIATEVVAPFFGVGADAAVDGEFAHLALVVGLASSSGACLYLGMGMGGMYNGEWLDV
jgi:hypothetical protein